MMNRKPASRCAGGASATASVPRLRSFVDGEWTAAEATYEVTSPASGAVLAAVGRSGAGDVDRAVAAARRAFGDTRWLPLRVRLDLCHRCAELLDARADSLARELAEEHGKPLAEALAEVRMAAEGFRVFAAEARHLDGWSPQPLDPSKRVLVIYQPRGVWALLTPWNFPLNIPVEYIAPALATGTAFVWKPAPTTARIAVRLMEVLIEAGAPAGMANLLLTDSTEVAQQLVTHAGIDAVGLTGGSRTGAAVAQAAWDKHLLLELGGNGPIVVLDDADLEGAGAAVASSAFFNAGQVCSAAGRVLADDRVADGLASRLVEHAGALRLGAPLSESVTLGPVHTESVAGTVDRHLADARDRGGAVRAGGSRAAGFPTRLFYEPTVIDHVPRDSLLATEETFGPVAPVVHGRDDDDLIAMANGGDMGLVSAVFTSSLSRAFRFAERLESGSVVVNDTSNYWEVHLPFGGRSGRRSGRGRVGGRAAIHEFVESKTVSIDVS